jgi:hypothetical protein
MPFGPFKRHDFELSSGEMLALQSVYTDAANGEFSVGKFPLNLWYRRLSRQMRDRFDTALAAEPLDETVISADITISLNGPSGNLLHKTVDAAIGHYSEQNVEATTISFSEEINILRGLSNALSSR